MPEPKRPFRGPTRPERPPRSDGGTIHKRARPVAWAACVAAVAFVAAVLSAVPAQAVTGYHIVVGSLGVNARSGPGTGYAAVGKLYNGQAIDIACQTKGSLVGVGLPGTPTDVWDQLTNGWYVTDYYTSTTGLNGNYTPGIPQCGGAPTPAPPPPTATPFSVTVNNGAVGPVWGSWNGKVLSSSVLPHPSVACRSGWEVTTMNNTAFTLHVPTNGNVTASRVDFGQSNSTYLLPGATGFYCVDFSRLNQVFFVMYDVNDGAARTMDGALLVAGALGYPTGATTELSNFISSVASIPSLTQIGACLGKSCAGSAFQAFLNDSQGKAQFVNQLESYARAVGQDKGVQWISDHLRQELVSIITTGWWVLRFSIQSAYYPTGYVEFDTTPVK